MTIIIKTVTKIASGFIFILGMYLAFHGHLTPGGGFSGGVIVAGVIILNLLVFNFRPDKRKIHLIELISFLLFILLALTPLVFGKSFMTNFLPKGVEFALISSGTIILFNLLVFGKVLAGLTCMFIEFFEENS